MNNLIERLRAEYEHRSMMEPVRKDLKAQAADRIEELEAEVERLKKELALQHSNAGAAYEQNAKLQEFVKWLQLEIKDIEANYLWASNERKIARRINRALMELHDE